MILPARHRHRIAFIALAVIVPVVFGAGLASREKPARANPIGAEMFGAASDRKLVWERSDFWERRKIRTRLLRNGSHSELLLSGTDELFRPDLLLYWIAADSQVGDRLPDDAVLVGSAQLDVPIPLKLPETIGKRPGRMMLYSLANHELVAISKQFNQQEVNP